MTHYPSLHSAPLATRLLAAAGALLAAASVAMAAYAAHAAQGVDASRMHNAALFAFGHGIALATLAARRPRALRTFALSTLLLGTLLFSGSLALAVFAGTRTTLAPIGGMAMIVSWLLIAIDALRH
ncbi:DUF423 domain-containing protein [Lysobacter sp. LF1]|uniref:DUF423 domain-containing protein n=1 Tax=Lysobacter stagni TaxID=3045172 RepID=A0ABT6XK39_9GAMM|nr:DUF423 domain-containing protein [Lysobacter sp. LF1]MDI9240537.1 DUF423 domain-containing protein [Lysobacter sp. LF1]